MALIEAISGTCKVMYREGTVTGSTASTVFVDYDNGEEVLSYILPYVYHCSDGEVLTNAEIIFLENDKVMLECDEDDIPQRVIGFTKGAKRCGTVFAIAYQNSSSIYATFNNVSRTFALYSAIQTAFNQFYGAPGYFEGVDGIYKIQFAQNSPFRIAVLSMLSPNSKGQYMCGKYCVTIIDVTNDGNFYLLHNKTIFLPIEKWHWNHDPPDDLYDGYGASIAYNGTDDIHATSVCPEGVEYESPSYVYSFDCSYGGGCYGGDPRPGTCSYYYEKEFCCKQVCSAIPGGMFFPAPGPDEICRTSWWTGTHLYDNSNLKYLIGGPGYTDFVAAGRSSGNVSYATAEHGPCIIDPDYPDNDYFINDGFHRWVYMWRYMADCSIINFWQKYGSVLRTSSYFTFPENLENLIIGNKTWLIPVDDFVTSRLSSFDYEEHVWSEELRTEAVISGCKWWRNSYDCDSLCPNAACGGNMILQNDLTGPAETQIRVDDVPWNIPETGHLAVKVNNTSTKVWCYYTSIDWNTETFTIDPEDFTETPATAVISTVYLNDEDETLYNIWNFYQRMIYPISVIGVDKILVNDALEAWSSDMSVYETHDYDGLYVGVDSLIPPEPEFWKVQANIPLDNSDFCLVWGKIDGTATTEVYSVSPMYEGNLRLPPGLGAPLNNTLETGVLIMADNTGWVIGPEGIFAYTGFEPGRENGDPEEDIIPNTVMPIGDPILSLNGTSWRWLDRIVAVGVFTDVNFITD